MTINQKQRLRIKRKMAEEKPSIWIGKNGVTEDIIKEISKQLERDQVVKIKVLKSIMKTNSISNLAIELAIRTDSILIEVRGYSLILYRMKKRD